MSKTFENKLIKKLLLIAMRDRFKAAKLVDPKNIKIGRTTKPDSEEQLPAISIYPQNESVEIFDMPKRYKREFTVLVEIAGIGDDGEDLTFLLEEVGEKVEAFMEVDDGFDDLVKWVLFSGASYQFEEGGQASFGSLLLTFTFEYHKEGIRKGLTCLDDFKELDIKYDIAGNIIPAGNPGEGTPVIDAVDEIDLPQT